MPTHLKSLQLEKLSAERKNDTGRLAKACKELGEWYMLHNRYQEAINEYVDLVAIEEVGNDNYIDWARFRWGGGR